MSKQHLAAALEVLGSILLIIAAFLIHVVFGFAAAGILAIVFGLALEAGLRSPQPAPKTDMPAGGDG